MAGLVKKMCLRIVLFVQYLLCPCNCWSLQCLLAVGCCCFFLSYFWICTIIKFVICTRQQWWCCLVFYSIKLGVHPCVSLSSILCIFNFSGFSPFVVRFLLLQLLWLRLLLLQQNVCFVQTNAKLRIRLLFNAIRMHLTILVLVYIYAAQHI